MTKTATKTAVGLSVREGLEIGQQYPLVSSGPMCDHYAADDDGLLYACTRPADHDGPHVAHVPYGSAVVMWD